MDDSSGLTFHSKLHEVLERLGDRKPSTTHEANAVIEHIRISKGHLDEETRSELDTPSAHGRENILRYYKRGRKTEAAYTKRSGLSRRSLNVVSLTVLVFPNSSTLRSIASSTN